MPSSRANTLLPLCATWASPVLPSASSGLLPNSVPCSYSTVTDLPYAVLDILDVVRNMLHNMRQQSYVKKMLVNLVIFVSVS